MNALRYLYLVPLWIFGAGLALGWLSLICVPFVLSWIERRSEATNKRLLELQAQREEIASKVLTFYLDQSYLNTDASKRPN